MRRLRPFCRRRFSMLRPSAVAIRLRKPHLRARFNLDGLYVRFMALNPHLLKKRGNVAFESTGCQIEFHRD